MRRTKAEAEQTREAVIGAAVAVFLERGVARATFDEIARAAGVTRALSVEGPVTIGGDPRLQTAPNASFRSLPRRPGDAAPQEHLDHRRHDVLAGLFCANGMHILSFIYIHDGIYIPDLLRPPAFPSASREQA